MRSVPPLPFLLEPLRLRVEFVTYLLDFRRYTGTSYENNGHPCPVSNDFLVCVLEKDIERLNVVLNLRVGMFPRR